MPNQPAAARIWPWLPVFRVVAETQHLPTAAARLHVSPSALSRTIHQIEDELGVSLFVRGSRRISLNAAGTRLLDAVRRSASTLERALPDVLGESFSGEYRVSSLGVLTDWFVLPALLGLASESAAVVPCMTTQSSRDANRKLANGEIEVAFYYDATSMPGIVCRRIGVLSNSLYVGRGHALFGKRDLAIEQLAQHAFSVAAIGDRGTPMDGWPVDVHRKIGFQILMLTTNVAIALTGRYVTVLPDCVAAPHVTGGALWRLPPSPVPDTEVYAACREEDAEQSFTRRLVDEVGALIGRAAQRPKNARRK